MKNVSSVFKSFTLMAFGAIIILALDSIGGHPVAFARMDNYVEVTQVLKECREGNYHRYEVLEAAIKEHPLEMRLLGASKDEVENYQRQFYKDWYGKSLLRLRQGGKVSLGDCMNAYDIVSPPVYWAQYIPTSGQLYSEPSEIKGYIHKYDVTYTQGLVKDLRGGKGDANTVHAIREMIIYNHISEREADMTLAETKIYQRKLGMIK